MLEMIAKLLALAGFGVAFVSSQIAPATADDNPDENLSVDWKFYGGAPPDLFGENACFYDSKGVEKLPNNGIRVWTKCLLDRDLQDRSLQDERTQKLISDMSAKKIANYYEPVISSAGVMKLDQKQAALITIWEQVSNYGHIDPIARTFYELKCDEREVRELSIYMHNINGQEGSSDYPFEWKHVSPEGGVAALLKILCPRT